VARCESLGGERLVRLSAGPLRRLADLPRAGRPDAFAAAISRFVAA
jgi:hypothetical protein